MTDEEVIRLHARDNNISRYRRLLKTNLSDVERRILEQPLSKENSAVESLVVQLPCQTLGKVEHFTRVRFEFWSLLTNGNIGTAALADHCGAPAGGRWLALLSRGKAVELDRPPDEPIDLSTLPLLNSNSNKASHPEEAAARRRYPVAPLD